jgi:hypothetical protein
VLTALVGFLVLGLTGRSSLPVIVALTAVGAVGVVVWLVLGARADRRMRDERAAGYSTVLDVPGFDYRDARTGALLRAAGEPPAATRAPESLVGRFLRLPEGSWLARQQSGESRDPQ